MTYKEYYEYFVAFQENLNASICMFSFSEVMDQMLLTVRGAVQGSFSATLGVASVFVHVVLRPGCRAWRCSPTLHHHHLDCFLRC